MAARRSAQPDGTPKRTVLLAGDLEGALVSHLRLELRRRYDLGFVAKKSIDLAKERDFQVAGSLVIFDWFTTSWLTRLQGYCKTYGPIFAVAFDRNFTVEKSQACRNLSFVRYRRYTTNVEEIIAAFAEIATDVRDMSKADVPAIVERREKYRALAFRVRNAAMAIKLLNLNSTSDVIFELESLGSEINDLSESDDFLRLDTRCEAKKALEIVASIYDHIENSNMAGLIVSGAVTAIIADVGWSAVACHALSLTAWHGKEPLLETIRMLPSLAGIKSKLHGTKKLRASQNDQLP